MADDHDPQPPPDTEPAPVGGDTVPLADYIDAVKHFAQAVALLGEQKAEIESLRAENAGLRRAQRNLSSGLLVACTRLYGIRRKPGGNAANQIKEILQLREQGWSFERIGRRFGITESAVRKRLERADEQSKK